MRRDAVPKTLLRSLRSNGSKTLYRKDVPSWHVHDALLRRAFVMLVAFLLAALPTTTRLAAQGPVGNAMQTIVAATVEAQQTQAAQNALAASQRATATALAIQQMQQAGTATAFAFQQIQQAATTTRAAENAQATQTAQAQATAVAATATEQARRAAAQAAQQTADAQATRTEQARSANATTTIETLHADATRTALALAADAAQRDAQFQTAFSVSGIVILWLAAAILFFYLIKRLRAKPRPIVVIEEAAGVSDTSAAPDFAPASEEPFTQSFVVTDPQAAFEIAQIIARDEDMQREVSDVDDRGHLGEFSEPTPSPTTP